MKRAFTLIELLIVLAILLILVSMVTWAVRGAADKAKTAKCISNLKNLHQAVLAFAQDETISGAADFPTDAEFKGSILTYYASSSLEKLKCPLSSVDLLGYKVNSNLMADAQAIDSSGNKCHFEEINNGNILIYEVDSAGSKATRHFEKCFGVTVFGEIDFDVSDTDLNNKTIGK